MSLPKLVFVTSNANKLKDVREILDEHFEVESVKLDLCEQQGTYEEIVKDKCRRAADTVSSFLRVVRFLVDGNLDYLAYLLFTAPNICSSRGYWTQL
jgi:inosine/xanthosine triphosphate pyrophosphatase family protein